MDMYSNFYGQQPNHISQHPNSYANVSGGGGGGGNYRHQSSQRRNQMMDPMMNGGGGGGGQQNRFINNENSSKTLWMGNIDHSMDENFIQFAFNTLGINVNNVKIIRNKDNGLPLGYGFVSFDDRSTAQEVLRELNGKLMPNVEDDKRFFLKRANRSGRFSVFVGNLPPQIDNEVLMNAFMNYYPSVSSAKVIMNDGISKGFGFVSFDDEGDYYNALNQQGMMLGNSPISVSKARNSQTNNNNGGSMMMNGNGNKSRVHQNHINNHNNYQPNLRDVRQSYY